MVFKSPLDCETLGVVLLSSVVYKCEIIFWVSNELKGFIG